MHFKHAFIQVEKAGNIDKKDRLVADDTIDDRNSWMWISYELAPCLVAPWQWFVFEFEFLFVFVLVFVFVYY